jgi:hypothetical protein
MSCAAAAARGVLIGYHCALYSANASVGACLPMSALLKAGVMMTWVAAAHWRAVTELQHGGGGTLRSEARGLLL